MQSPSAKPPPRFVALAIGTYLANIPNQIMVFMSRQAGVNASQYAGLVIDDFIVTINGTIDPGFGVTSQATSGLAILASLPIVTGDVIRVQYTPSDLQRVYAWNGDENAPGFLNAPTLPAFDLTCIAQEGS